jgi:glycosyltransferase involved in cell wall biosynthesis
MIDFAPSHYGLKVKEEYPMKMYFFDVTDIMIYVEKEETVSGIQRVSFEVIRRIAERLGADAVKLTYWDRARREYMAIESSFMIQMDEFSSDLLSSFFFGKNSRPQGRTAPTLGRYRNRPLKYRLNSFVRSFHAMRGHEEYFTARGSSIAEWRAFKAEPNGAGPIVAPKMKRITASKLMKPGDQLVILGATWGIEGLQPHLRELKDLTGVGIYQLVHDLIPIVAPEHIADDFSLNFYRWLEVSTKYCDGFFANSRNTARDLQNFLQEIGHSCPVYIVPLAQKFTAAQLPGRKKRISSMKRNLEAIAELDRSILNIAKNPYVLVVGTLETRKNLWRLAQAWLRLSAEAGLDVPKLVFAGRRGWYNDDFDALMMASGNLGGWVQFAERPSDAELAFLYENCLFTATVSFYEGWGLPIGESLSFGKTAVVAANSSMPEVGGDLVEYCEAHSIDSIFRACRRLIAEIDYRETLERRIAAKRLRTWDDVTEDFLSTLVG